MPTLSESEDEGVLLDQLSELGYACLNDAISGPDGGAPEREAYSDTILAARLREIRSPSGRRPAVLAFPELLNICEGRDAF